MRTPRQHFWAKMFDVGDLPVLTVGNCLLKTEAIKWPLKLYVRFLRFYGFSQNPKTRLFTFFWVVAHVFSNIDYYCYYYYYYTRCDSIKNNVGVYCTHTIQSSHGRNSRIDILHTFLSSLDSHYAVGLVLMCASRFQDLPMMTVSHEPLSLIAASIWNFTTSLLCAKACLRYDTIRYEMLL